MSPPDYSAMSGPALLLSLGDDASKWAAAFRQIAIKIGYSDMDEGWLTTWFANAIEHSDDLRYRRGKYPVAHHLGDFPCGRPVERKGDDLRGRR